MDNRSEDVEKQRAFFDSVAPVWRNRNPLTESEVEHLLSDIPFEKGKRVLDVACGTGVLDACLAKKGLSVDAVDVSEKMIERARNNAANAGVRYFVADFYAFEGEYDLLLVFDAYPHFTDKARFAEVAHGLLCDGGELWIFFDEGRKGINAHHAGHAAEVSVPLRSAEEEAEALRDYFDPILLRDGETIYKIGLKKKKFIAKKRKK